MKFVIQGKLPSLNEYIRDCRGNKYLANKRKKDVQKRIYGDYLATNEGTLGNPPYSVKLHFVEPHKRRDIDNVMFGSKYIFDTLVFNNVIENDNQTYIKSIEIEVSTDKDNPRIEVEFMEE